MRGARWIAGAVAASALILASLWTCAEGAGDAQRDVGGGRDAGPEPDRATHGTTSREQPRPPRARVPVTGAPAAGGDESSAAEGSAPAAPGALTGRVVTTGEDDVVPLPGARVRLQVSPEVDAALKVWPPARLPDVPEPAGEALTGADGLFRLEVPPGATWRIVVTAEGLAAQAFVGEGSSDLGDLLLQERHELKLLVEDETGRALASAEARVVLEGDRPAYVVRADAAGRIVLDERRPALVTAPGHAFAWVETPRDGETVRLETAAPIAGKVVDDTGAALTGIAVVLADAEIVAVTAPDGSFRFERASVRCGPEGVNLWVNVPPNGRELVQAVPGDEAVRIVIPRMGFVEGSAVFEDGRPAAGAQVLGSTLGPDGRFRLTLSPPPDGRKFDLHALLSGHAAGVGIRTHEGRAEVSVRPGETVEGVQLVLEATPHSFFRLDVRDGDDRPVLASAWTPAPWLSGGGLGADGKTLFAVGVPPGTALVVAVSPQKADLDRKETALVTSADPAVEPVLVRLDGPRSYTPRAIDSSGNPLGAGEAQVRAAAQPGIILKADGRVVALAGTWVQINVQARGLRMKVYAPVPPPPKDTIDVVVPGTGTVRGRFVGADGRPAPGVSAAVQPSIGGVEPSGSDEIGADGRFEVSPVAAGRGWLYGWREDHVHSVASRSVVVPEGGVVDVGDVLVSEEKLLEGRVVGEDGAGAGGAVVVVSWNRREASASVATSPDGRFSLRVLAAPDAVASVSRRDGTACVEALTFTEARGPTFRLRPSGTVEVRVPVAWDEAGWDVRLEPTPGAFAWEPETDHEGRTATLRGIPAGRWVVVVTVDGVAHRREVVVPPRAVAVVEMGP